MSCVTNDRLEDGSVTGSKIGDSTIETRNLKYQNISFPKISDNSVSTKNIQDNSITSEKIKDNVINSPQLNKLNQQRQALTNESQPNSSNLSPDPLFAAISPNSAPSRFTESELSLLPSPSSSPLTKDLQNVFDSNLHITSPSSASSNNKEYSFSPQHIQQNEF
eukprot:gb/GECH01009832.1/.p1 GENE.gb/GECH01009832.1/~~gb/GECH01009832.1/.p1  ORF type:complete len:164 (+),score=38.53 gb/GECH01009832.1/:1-492(+)